MSAGAWRRMFAISLSATLASAAVAATTRTQTRLARAVHALEDGRPADALRLATLPPDRVDGVSEYVRGTALLALGRADEAADALETAARRAGTVDARRRALHNLALAHLTAATAASRPLRELEARASVVAGREALRLRPGAPGTSWNLALAQRLAGAGTATPNAGDRGGVRLEPGASSSGGGATADASGGSRMLSPEEARAILDALRSDEASSLSRSLARLLGGEGPQSKSGGARW